ncbi:MAG: hypothetical protein J1E02_01000 [Coprobacter sp.]|nr:hypothetical protein [Coprobacter sp.]
MAEYKQPMQMLLPTLSSWNFKPPSSIMEDKISITPLCKLSMPAANALAVRISDKFTKKCYKRGYKSRNFLPESPTTDLLANSKDFSFIPACPCQILRLDCLKTIAP